MEGNPPVLNVNLLGSILSGTRPRRCARTSSCSIRWHGSQAAAPCKALGRHIRRVFTDEKSIEAIEVIAVMVMTDLHDRRVVYEEDVFDCHGRHLGDQDPPKGVRYRGVAAYHVKLHRLALPVDRPASS